MKKIFLICLFLFTGCYKYNDLNDLAIIKSIGISHDNIYTLYAEVIEEIDKNNNPKTSVLETTGNNIDELFNNIKQIVNKEIYFAHIDLLLFDFNLNKSDYQLLIDYFLNNNSFRNDFYCVLAKDIKSILSQSKYNEIENLLETNKDSKNIIKFSFEDLTKRLLEENKFIISEIKYDNGIMFTGNYIFQNNKLERINNEKEN